jgi:hypothetical protein
MVFVHKLAQTNRLGSPLRADRKSVFEGHHLPTGTTASVFHCRVFEGAALALEIAAADLERVGAAADPVGDNPPCRDSFSSVSTEPASPAKPSAILPDGDVEPALTTSARPVPLDEANTAAKEYLDTASEPTARGCVEHIRKSCKGSFSLGRLGKLDAWNAHMKEQRANGGRRRASKGTSVDSIPLTETMRAVTPDRKAIDPIDSLSDSLIDEILILERKFLEHPKTIEPIKNDYYKMDDENRKRFLRLWESQWADEEQGQIIPV